nr:retrovirus-related Pol polyprotein from transposon TNT 1-94 [Tanacetum cinerariifolium]
MRSKIKQGGDSCTQEKATDMYDVAAIKFCVVNVVTDFDVYRYGGGEALGHADYAGCKDSFKSTSGGAQFLGEKLVSWSSKKQDCMVLSTAKAEYVSLSACSIAISCNPVQHSRTKHIAVHYHYIKEHVEKGTIELYFVKMDYQLADMFSKALPVDRFNYLVCRLARVGGIYPGTLPLDRVEVLVFVGNLDDDLSISSSLHNLTEDDLEELSAGTSLPKGVSANLEVFFSYLVSRLIIYLRSNGLHLHIPRYEDLALLLNKTDYICVLPTYRVTLNLAVTLREVAAFYELCKKLGRSIEGDGLIHKEVMVMDSEVRVLGDCSLRVINGSVFSISPGIIHFFMLGIYLILSIFRLCPFSFLRLQMILCSPMATEFAERDVTAARATGQFSKAEKITPGLKGGGGGGIPTGETETGDGGGGRHNTQKTSAIIIGGLAGLFLEIAFLLALKSAFKKKKEKHFYSYHISNLWRDNRSII